MVNVGESIVFLVNVLYVLIVIERFKMLLIMIKE